MYKTINMIRVTYYAEGRLHGSKCTLVHVCGKVFDDFVIDEGRWYSASNREQEQIILGVARREYPEAEWEHAHHTEIHQV